MATSTSRKSQSRTGKAWDPTESRQGRRSQASCDKQATRGKSTPLLSLLHLVRDIFKQRAQSNPLLCPLRGPVKDNYHKRAQSNPLLRLLGGPVKDNSMT